MYTYAKDGNRDRLASVDGKKIEYVDGSRGTPNNYCGNATEFGTFNRLSKYKGLTFNYSASGERLSKTHEEGESKFHYAGGKLIAEERTITDDAFKIYPQINGANGADVNNSYFYASSTGESYSYSSRALRVTLEYIYGANGLTGFSVTRPILNGTEKQTYFYRRNLQGDVTHVFDEAGILKAKYAYDAWGNCKIIYSQDGIATLNPIRYRGYYFDNETGLFYTPGRYYDPEVGRWINADDVAYLDPETIGGLNLYSYCLNNPISYIDPDGHAPKWWQWLLFGIGATLVVAATVVVSIATFGTGTAFASLGGAILLGAAKGAIIGAAIGSAVGIVGGAIYSGVTGADMGDSILQGFLMGFGGGAIVGAVIGGAVGGVQFGTFGSKASLNTHLTKHGTKMGYSNASEYAKGAKYVIKNGTKVSYTYKGKLTTGYIRFLGQGGGANYAFVGMHGTRAATFGIRSVSELVRLGIPWLMI